ncbi:MAG TPA: S8 family serine peptidase [Gemmatimonadaceae bacterium]|nr:S8 family serine peptidase [Gemmatimonadaceae bacterium]
MARRRIARLSAAAATAAAALVLAACSDATVAPESAAAPLLATAVRGAAPEQVMPGEVIVKLRDGADVEAVAKAHGLALGERGYKGTFAVLRGAAAGAERAAAARLQGDARVEYAEPNFLRQPSTIDARLWAFSNPGGLNMLFTTGRYAGLPLGASSASLVDADEDNVEGYAADGADVVVGSIDTGVDLTHPEFTGRLIAGNDWYTGDNNPSDEDGHGSHTTGTMAGTTVGVAGIAGAAPHVKVYVQRVCGRRGCPTSAIVNAIRAAADFGVVAMNISIGGSSEAQSEKDAIAYALSKNALVIASAGNNSTGTVSCPACDVNAISVAATDWRDARASYSNWGAGLDIAAPGGNCYSNTTPEGCIYSAYLAGGYAWEQGTSMAAPQVTGTAAIVASKTGLRGTALRDRILSTADDRGAPGYDTIFGNGRLNSYRAVTGTSLAAGQ